MLRKLQTKKSPFRLIDMNGVAATVRGGVGYSSQQQESKVIARRRDVVVEALPLVERNKRLAVTVGHSKQFAWTR